MGRFNYRLRPASSQRFIRKWKIVMLFGLWEMQKNERIFDI